MQSFPVELSLNEVTWDGSKMYVAVLKNLTERRKLEKQILEIGDKERKRIGSELHDNLGQLLTGIRLQTEGENRTVVKCKFPNLTERSQN